MRKELNENFGKIKHLSGVSSVSGPYSVKYYVSDTGNLPGDIFVSSPNIQMFSLQLV